MQLHSPAAGQQQMQWQITQQQVAHQEEVEQQQQQQQQQPPPPQQPQQQQQQAALAPRQPYASNAGAMIPYRAAGHSAGRAPQKRTYCSYKLTQLQMVARSEHQRPLL